jgi:hypothetical protein
MRENVRIFGSESGRAGSGELVTLFIGCEQYALCKRLNRHGTSEPLHPFPPVQKFVSTHNAAN